MKDFFILISFLAMISCVHETVPSAKELEEIRIRFKVELSDANMPATRVLSDQDESFIGSIDLLAFVQQGDDYRYSYHAAGSYNSSTSSFTATVRKFDSPQVFVILANASAAYVASGITQQDNLSDALQKIIVTSQTEWPARNNGAAEFTPIPMYAKTAPVAVTSSTAALGPYGILRMLARLDVSLAPVAAGNFVMTQVMIYNRKTAGYVAYDDADWNAANQTVTAAGVPPFYPGTTDDPTVLEPSLVYNVPGSGALRQSLYTFEAKGVQDRELATCLVIGGNYDAGGNPSASGEISYYRIDIKTPQTPSGYVSQDILRNHLYNIVVREFTGKGATTPDDAFFGSAVIDAQITPWNLAQNSVIFDGQHSLVLSRDKLNAGNEGFSASLNLTTDYTGVDTGLPVGIFIGPVVYTSGGSGWLTVSNNIGANGSMERNIQITGSSNATGSDRTAQFTITVGNLQYAFKVNQSKDPWLSYGYASIYFMNGRQAFLTASSNFGWTVQVKSGTNVQGGLTELLTTSGGHAENEFVFFNTYDDEDDMLAGNPQKTADTAVLTFRDIDGVCPDVDVKIWLASGVPEGSSNCYMMAPGSYPILIPVERANAPSVTGTAVVGQQIGPNDVLGASFVWTDSPSGLSPQGAVRSVIPAGDGSVGYLLVRPGSSVGNTVVAVTTGGIIRWSWHIWVTGYQPSGNWLDRNLGALSNVPGSPGVGGLLYQWGRKDPFPAATDLWYDQNGTLNQPAITTIAGNINAPVTEVTSSVRNPFSFFTSPYNARSFSWGGNLPDKEIYDPCPPGYKVPVYTLWQGLNTTTFPWNGSNGRTNASVGGFYPVTGARNNGGVLVQPGNGYYWSTESTSSMSPRLSFTSTSVSYNVGNLFNHIDAYAIRCVAENPQ